MVALFWTCERVHYTCFTVDFYALVSLSNSTSLFYSIHFIFFRIRERDNKIKKRRRRTYIHSYTRTRTRIHIYTHICIYIYTYACIKTNKKSEIKFSNKINFLIQLYIKSLYYINKNILYIYCMTFMRAYKSTKVLVARPPALL